MISELKDEKEKYKSGLSRNPNQKWLVQKTYYGLKNKGELQNKLELRAHGEVLKYAVYQISS